MLDNSNKGHDILRISPTNDLALKKVLASEENKDILQGLVHDFFGLTVRCDDIVLDHPYSSATRSRVLQYT
jgi:hypothetical protein